jgi:PAS domain S-box-containing protein
MSSPTTQCECLLITAWDVASRFFLPSVPEYGSETTIILSTLLESSGYRTGVLAQILQNSTVDRTMSRTGLPRKHDNATQTNGSRYQQTGERDHQVDDKQLQLFQRFAELLPNGLAILDSEAEAVFVNDAFFKLTTNNTSKGFRAWPESLDPRDYERVMKEYRTAFTRRDELRVEFRCISQDQSEQWRLFLLRPLTEEMEDGFICALVDITEIKSAELAQEKVANDAQERKEQQESKPFQGSARRSNWVLT